MKADRYDESYLEIQAHLFIFAGLKNLLQSTLEPAYIQKQAQSSIVK